MAQSQCTTSLHPTMLATGTNYKGQTHIITVCTQIHTQHKGYHGNHGHLYSTCHIDKAKMLPYKDKSCLGEILEQPVDTHTWQEIT